MIHLNLLAPKAAPLQGEFISCRYLNHLMYDPQYAQEALPSHYDAFLSLTSTLSTFLSEVK